MYGKRYKQLFENKKVVFLLINDYKNSYVLKWLETLTNEYIHFGDYFNLDIGLKELYDKQKCFLNIKSEDVKVQKLIELIKKHKKSIEQENLINKKI